MDTFIQLTVNLSIMFLNAFMAIKIWILHFPYFKFITILITAWFIYKLSLYEAEEIKQPYTKAGRRRV